MRRILPVLLFTLVGCVAPRASITPLAAAAYPPTPDTVTVPFFQTTPTCAFEEVALVSVMPSLFWQRGPALSDALRTKARALGGNGVVRVTSKRVVDGASASVNGDGVDLDAHTELSGTVIRFRDAGCAR